MNNKTGSKHGQQVVRNTKKQETLGNVSKHGLRLWHDMDIHGTQKDPNTVIFPNALF